MTVPTELLERLRLPLAALRSSELERARADERVRHILMLACVKIENPARWTHGAAARDANGEACCPHDARTAVTWAAHGAVVFEWRNLTRRVEPESVSDLLDLALWVADQAARKIGFADLIAANEIPHPGGVAGQWRRAMQALRLASLAANPPTGPWQASERQVLQLTAERVVA